jgi:predicted nucleic acid-binding protein
MGAVALDASVLIAYLNRDDHHHRRAVDMLGRVEASGRRPIATATALAETLVGPERLGRAAEAVGALRGAGVAVGDRDARIARAAAELRVSRRLAMPDALVLAEALAEDAALASFDDRLARMARSLRAP